MYDKLYVYIQNFLNNFYAISVRPTPRNMLFLDYYNNARHKLGRVVGTMLMDLSNPRHMAVCFIVYGLDNNSLSYVLDQLTSRSQKTKIGTCYNKGAEFFSGNTARLSIKPIITYDTLFFFFKKKKQIVISQLMIPYIYLENIYSELNKTWFMIRKFYLNGVN